MTKRVRYSVLTAIALLLVAIPSMLWYRANYSMTVARSFASGADNSGLRILIATQGSDYKDALVKEIVDGVRPRMPYVRVIDVSELPTIVEAEWSAIVVIHTWEYGQPEPHAASMVSNARTPRKFVVVTTSGNGSEKLPGVDAISTASETKDVAQVAGDVVSRLNEILSASQ